MEANISNLVCISNSNSKGITTRLALWIKSKTKHLLEVIHNRETTTCLEVYRVIIYIAAAAAGIHTVLKNDGQSKCGSDTCGRSKCGDIA